ncbi:MAG: hypothetical protein ACLTWO_10050 [Blautia massiliensis (ex Durand et al. 2017)]|nr:MAG: hypothetical protein DBX91_15465 [Subdoligranulum variabile]
MSLLKKLVGLAAGAAAVGAVLYVLQKHEHGEEYEHIVGPEGEGEAASSEPETDASVEEEPSAAAFPQTDAVYQPPVAAHPAPTEDTPNANPVELGAVEVPKTADGKYDATKIADPADFGDWDEQGCKG